mmetsp:Transcript_39/g.80  ORF Transcript_39/g.80 Transcript_39/m.80 type:complete len:1082 (+) Transcript_39:405-3650(+)
MCTVDRQQILKMTDTRNNNHHNNDRNHDDDDDDDLHAVKSLPSPSKVRETISRINEPQSRETNLSNLVSLGSIDGIASFLHTNRSSGLSSSSISQRRSLYGCNALPSSPRKTWFQLFVDSFDDETVQILIAAAIVSLLVGMYDDPKTGYIEGCAILAAVLIVSIVTACNDYQKETQFRALSKANDDVQVLVKRDNVIVSIAIDEVVLGDIISVEAGDSIPCDGLLIKADSLSVDESALTGEPMDVEKNLVQDPFVLSGCIATAGTAEFIAIAVGKDSQWGIIKAHLEKEQDQTPLQEKLDSMAQIIGYVGMASAAATFLAMMFIYIVVQPEYLKDTSLFAHALEAFIIGVTIVVVAVPEGLPLAVTIALAYSTKKMLRDKNLIRHLAACETMGNATNICSDKTGTLTENRMTVVKGIFANVRQDDTAPESNTVLNADVSDFARDIILQNIATCSTARILTKAQPQDLASSDVLEEVDNRMHVVGNKTEGALLILAQSSFMGGDDYEVRRARAEFGLPRGSRIFPFSSKRKRMSVLVKEGGKDDNGSDSVWTLYHKGAGEIVLENCTSFMDKDGSIQPMTSEKKRELENVISSFASQALRCVALAHRPDIHKVIDPDTCTEEDCASKCEKEMTLDALVGIVDPLRGDVVDAVKTCQKAGIFVRMVTGDNLETAKAIAKQAGILTEGGLSMVGEEFRKLTPAQLDEILPRLQVLARSSPEDKHILVERLNGGLMPKTKEEWMEAHPGRDWETERDLLLPGYYDEWAQSRNGVGEVVGVTGDGTNDGPALKAADVGLSMGISGTDVAKNASDIIIMDDKFSSIVKAVLWGRSVFDNIRKFLQFQLTVNVVALTITFISAVAGYRPPLNAVMMLWVNLIMDTMGALALGTEPPASNLLLRRPYRRDASLINLPMWRNILAQASYQLGLLIFLLQKGPEIFGCASGSTHHFTIIFNAFVFCQVFNEFNAREIDDVFNPLKNLGQSPMFLGVIIFTIFAQWVIVEFGGDFTQTRPLTFEEWKVTSLLGAMSIPVGFIMRLIPVNENPDSFAGLQTDESSVPVKKGSSILTIFVLPIAAAIMYKVVFD